MHPGVVAAFAASGGLITRSAALDLGLSPATIRSLVRHGEWVLVRRGVYCDAPIWQAADEYVGRPRLRARAAILTMRRAWVLSHDSAAHELGLAILAPPAPFVHITRPGFTGAWTEYGVKHHLARFHPEQVLHVNDVPVLDHARTAVDIGRERGERDGLIACDSALRMGVRRSELEAALEPMRNWPNVTRARTAVGLADGGAQNPGEGLLRELVIELALSPEWPETQFPLWIEDRVAWCDLRVGCHVFEFDGRVKYRRADEGGFADRPEDVIWAEKKRERLIAAEGLGVSRLIWEDFWGERREAAKVRVRAEWEVTRARFGTRLPEHLVRAAAAIRAQRGA
ncbi:type IV toxin-antitoxin system AbiEi family antitoxin domain-containing protein [Nocardioides sp. cx-169]|uniref:type IV toxin-antitoxin system AbiEi family antitoxin domain-containing protein n=1 Tax=Nocardioides sp. cx-169 TaxID=2899080 RepID=UPI001E550B35|nr:type IV toxin-antitoxin system AbiEi family antitoxin domain-containing protein [Nocardioides sp. cx-169]MCD4533394.1 type IV toxin-antitoxin system AbiEi family antitoxin domain-containing protein [Nocardioides sp. cx-169]